MVVISKYAPHLIRVAAVLCIYIQSKPIIIYNIIDKTSGSSSMAAYLLDNH
jgi:hypothetical protein